MFSGVAQRRQFLDRFLLLQMINSNWSACLHVQRLVFVLNEAELSFNIADEFLLLLLKNLSPLFQLVQVGRFLDSQIVMVSFGSTRCWSRQSFLMSALRTYVLKWLFVWLLIHLRIDSSQNKLHLQIIRQILYK